MSRDWGLCLLRGTEQRRDPRLGEVIADQVGDTGVTASDPAGDLSRLGVVEPVAAVLHRLLDLKQVVIAQQLDLDPRGAVGPVALGRVAEQAGGDGVGTLKRCDEAIAVVGERTGQGWGRQGRQCS